MLERGDRHLLTGLAGRSLGVVLLLACAGGDAPAGDGRGTPGDGAEESDRETAAEDTVEGLSVALATDRVAYPAGEPVRMTLTVTNALDDTVTFRFSSSQRYEFVVRDVEDPAGSDAGRVRWRWSEERMFTQVTGTESVPPGRSLRYEAVFEQALPPGLYTVDGFLAAVNRSIGARDTFRVRE